MSPEFAAFRRFILGCDGVTYVGPERAPLVGVEGAAHVGPVRSLLHPNLRSGVFVTGSLVVPTAKHPGVATYEQVAATTKP